MTRRYDAFLIRYWSLDDDNRQRVEVTHIRSGARALVASQENAMGWMQVRVKLAPMRGTKPTARGGKGQLSTGCDGVSTVALCGIAAPARSGAPTTVGRLRAPGTCLVVARRINPT